MPSGEPEPLNGYIRLMSDDYLSFMPTLEQSFLIVIFPQDKTPCFQGGRGRVRKWFAGLAAERPPSLSLGYEIRNGRGGQTAAGFVV